MQLKDLTKRQLDDITIIERVTSTFSLMGCLWIAVTFIYFPGFRRPINRLVFYASVGNIATNIATLISRSALSEPRGGLCQAQAFLIQMFMSADAFWTLAMAANVWLTFYHKYDSAQLRRLEVWYLLLCYGVPFVPALVFIFINTGKNGAVYGNATLWCWIGGKWEILRIASFYGPVWLVILATCAIYVRAGKDIYTKRQQLRAFHNPPPEPLPIIADPFTSCKTTEVMVTSEAVTSSDTIDLAQLAPRAPEPGETTSSVAKPNQSYQVTVSSNAQPMRDDGRWSYQEKVYRAQRKESIAQESTVPLSQHISHTAAQPARRYAAMEANNAAWSYTKVAVLFFLAMMVTWIPSSANRVFSVVHPGQVSLPLQFASAFVLPLQGFWNAVIYTTTSLTACKQMWRQLKEGRRSSRGSSTFKMKQVFGSDDREAWPTRRSTRGGNKFSMEETESMTELQASRPVTKDTNSR